MKSIVYVFPTKEHVKKARENGFHVIGVFAQEWPADKYMENHMRAAILECDIVLFCKDWSAEAVAADPFSTNIKILADSHTIVGTFCGFDEVFLFYRALQKYLKFEMIDPGGNFKSKVHFRNFLADNGYSNYNPQFYFTKNLNSFDPSKFHGKAFIIKPASSAGSENVHLIANLDEWQQTLEKLSGKDSIMWILEEYIFGTQYSIETISVFGQHKVVGVTQKFDVKPPHFIEKGGIFPVSLPQALHQKLESFVLEILKIVKMESGFSHTEFFITPEGVIKIVESHLRRPGQIPKLFYLAYGIEWMDYFYQSLHRRQLLPLVKKSLAAVEVIEFEKDQVIPTEISNSSIMFYELEVSVKGKSILSRPTSNYDRHGFLRVKGSTWSELKAQLQQAKQIIREEIAEVINEPY